MMKNELGIGEAAKTLFALANNGAKAEPRKARRQLAGATSMKTKSFFARLALLIACPLGIGSAIYLAEYSKKENRFVRIVRLTTETLTGIPSIIYGLFGMLLFVGFLRCLKRKKLQTQRPVSDLI